MKVSYRRIRMISQGRFSSELQKVVLEDLLDDRENELPLGEPPKP